LATTYEKSGLGQIGVGATRQWNNLQLALVFRATTGEKQRNQKNFSFGTLSFSWAL
jgi:lipid A 3-O-deacylase|tara:strand:+ start:395 stop:562 length:168 start_codon:yes stop_codon:yes gene_type:complete